MTDTPKPQPDKFRDAARELGCDEDEARFEETLRKVAKASRAEQGTPAEQVRALIEERNKRLADHPEPDDPLSDDLHGGYY